LLHQAFAHCGRFLTAASRRSLGRVSVPVWLVNLSIQLPVVALVGRYLTNKLIGQKFLPERINALLIAKTIGNYLLFREAMSYSGADTNVLLTRSPLTRRFVRLACIRHTASVNPEPGSNSPKEELDSSVCFLTSSYSSVQRKFKGLDLFSAIILLSKGLAQKKSASSKWGFIFPAYSAL
jgi:hypothetical protein